MAGTPASGLAACAAVLAAVFSATLAAAQPEFDKARTLYLGAQYEESLALLTALRGATTAEQNEIATYALFCELALGKTEEADRTIESIVSSDPFYRPSEDLASPRILDVFRQTRSRLLPDIVRRDYAAAKLAFDRKDAGSSAMFDRVLKLLADPDLDAPVEGDLRVLAEGFRDLSRSFAAPAAAAPSAAASSAAAAAPARTSNRAQELPSAPMRAEGSTPAADRPAPAGRQTPSQSPAAGRTPTRPPAAVPTSVRAGAPAESIDPLTLRPAREGDAGVVPPEAISQTLPRWVPSNAVESSTDYAGVIEVVIDADGSVRSTTMRESVHMQYDRQLLRSARSWKFKPATRNGEPVPYTMLIQVHLKPVVQ